MHPEFWTSRWKENRIGFHQTEYNSRLLQHWQVEPDQSNHIFVPLCGKSLDMRYLSEFGMVTGIELSDLAVRAFFEEWSEVADVYDYHGYTALEANHVRLLRGDLFQMPSSLYGNFTHVYDRASMIALPSEMRAKYVEVLHRLLQPGGEVLLVTIEYPDGELPGPPFSVGSAWLRQYASFGFSIEHLESIDTWRADSPLAEEGLTALDTHVFRLTRR
ncbi:MAG: thiopurine S-methyltransferase [Bradymonadia bacterium]